MIPVTRMPPRGEVALEETSEPVYQETPEDYDWASNLPSMPQRKIGRIVSLQTLYESDFSKDDTLDIFERSVLCERMGNEEMERARSVVKKAASSKETLDKKVESVLKYGSIETMPKVELNIIRLALTEADICSDTDMAVVASEAVELAKLFGGEKAPGFVNKTLSILLGERRDKSSTGRTAEADNKIPVQGQQKRRK